MKGFYSALLALAALVTCSFPVTAQDSLARLLQRPAPDFTLADTTGTMRSLSGYRHRPVALFFFCGCAKCAECARLWGQFQRSNTLPPARQGEEGTKTLIVYAGDAEAARSLAEQTGLDMKQTAVLSDAQMGVTLGLYKSDPCPRVFVLDQAGIVRYINCHQDDAPRSAPVTTIALCALRALQTYHVVLPAVAAPSPKPMATAPASAARHLSQRALRSKSARHLRSSSRSGTRKSVVKKKVRCNT